MRHLSNAQFYEALTRVIYILKTSKKGKDDGIPIKLNVLKLTLKVTYTEDDSHVFYRTFV